MRAYETAHYKTYRMVYPCIKNLNMNPWMDELKRQSGLGLWFATALEQSTYKTWLYKHVKNKIKEWRGYAKEQIRIAAERLKLRLRYQYYWNECIKRDGHPYCYVHAKVGIYHEPNEIDHEVSLENGGHTEE